MTNDTFIIANDATIAILADASPELLDAIHELMNGTNWAKAGRALNRDDRRNLLIIRDNLTKVILP